MNGASLERVQNVPRVANIEDSTVGFNSRLDLFERSKSWKAASSEEDWNAITAIVRSNHLSNFDGVITKEVVKSEIADFAEHIFGVIPVAVKLKDVSIVGQKLLEGIDAFVRSKRLH